MYEAWDVSDIISKVQHISTLYTYVLLFYKKMWNLSHFPLEEIIELAKIFPYHFQKQQFEPFIRILKSPLDFQEKLKRLRELLSLGVSFGIHESAKVVTLCDDFWDRIEKVKEISWLQDISSDELWWIFRGKWVSLYSLNLLIGKLKKYDTKWSSLQDISRISDVFDEIIEERKELFERLWNVFSQEDIHRICSCIKVETEYLERLIEVFLEQEKRPETREQIDELVYEFLDCSNARNYSNFNPTCWVDDILF